MKEEFINLLLSTGRENIANLIRDIDEKGFFVAPASSGHHLAVKEGLVKHSLHVYHTAMALKDAFIKCNEANREILNDESIIICSLLHDICKSEFYVPASKRKCINGVWMTVDGFDCDYTKFPFGHGEKSVVMILNNGVHLSEDEMLAIRFHMGYFHVVPSEYELKGYFNSASKNPLVLLIQMADYMSSKFEEE